MRPVRGWKVSLSKKLCDKVHRDLWEILSDLEVKYFIDPRQYEQQNKCKPEIASIFIFGNGGTYTCGTGDDKNLSVYQGTLHIYATPSETFDFGALGRAYLKMYYK